MDGVIGVIGLFDEPDKMESAAVDTPWTGRELVRISPAPPHAMEESPVRFFTSAGAITGIIGGFLASCFTALKYLLNVSGKPFIMNGAYAVVMFELMVLCATSFTLISVLALSILPNLFRNRLKLPPWHRPDLTHDRWGLYVPCSSAETDSVENELRRRGADRVEKVTAS